MQTGLSDKRKIFSGDGDEELWWFVYETWNKRFCRLKISNTRTFFLWWFKRTHTKRDVFILERFDCFRMNDCSAVISELDCIVIADLFKLHWILRITRIGTKNSRDIFPNNHFFCIQTIRKDSGSIIWSFSTKCSSEIFRSSSDETLCENDIVFFVQSRNPGFD